MDLGSLAAWISAGVAVAALLYLGVWRTRKRLRVEIWERDVGAGGIRTYEIKVINTGWMALSTRGPAKTVTITIPAGVWDSLNVRQHKKAPRQWSDLDDVDQTPMKAVIDEVTLNRGDRLVIRAAVKAGSDEMPKVDIRAEDFRWKVRKHYQKP